MKRFLVASMVAAILVAVIGQFEGGVRNSGQKDAGSVIINTVNRNVTR